MLIKLKKMKSCISKNKRMRRRSNKSKNKKINNIKMQVKKSFKGRFHAKSLKTHYKQLINLANCLLKFDMTLIS